MVMALVRAVFLVGKPTEYSRPWIWLWLGEPVQQLVGGAGPVGPNQQPATIDRRDLRDGPAAQQIDVVPGMVVG
jgi:hypothetical protein